MSHSSHPGGFTPPHGSYENLLSFQKARIIYDGTLCFCGRFIHLRSRTRDQMVQAARSGKQNILEASQASGGSKEAEIKLTYVARASLEELFEDYRDFLRTGDHVVWPKNSKEALYVRGLGAKSNRSHESYRSYFETRLPEVVANILICLIHPTTCSTSSSAVWSAISSRKAACANACCAPASKLAPGANHNRSYRSYPSYQGGPNPAKSAA
jgi:hypothetical protein